jgi:hypothetical protein
MERGREKQNKRSGEERGRTGRRKNMVVRHSNARKKLINQEYQTKPNGKREGETD